MYVTTEGQNLEAGFNPKYFLDALRAIDDQESICKFWDKYFTMYYKTC